MRLAARIDPRWATGTPSLDTVVTWTLMPVEGGTRLRLVHAGFRSPDNDFAFDIMSPGWGRVLFAVDDR
jgi:uncharacterized protein YndB with AHSA1/START domain